MNTPRIWSFLSLPAVLGVAAGLSVTACAVGSDGEDDGVPAGDTHEESTAGGDNGNGATSDGNTTSGSTSGGSTSGSTTTSSGSSSSSGSGGSGSGGSGSGGGTGTGGGASSSSSGAPVAMCAQNLSTGNTTQGGWDGQMFDVTASETVTISALALNLYAGKHDVEIHFTALGFEGHEMAPAVWTLAVSAPDVVSSGPGTPVTVDLTTPVTIPAGEQYGFYVTTIGSDGLGVEYSGGVSVGSVAASDANVAILDGVGSDYPFGGSIGNGIPRRFNGMLVYEAACAP
jgi:hypothetical protein